MANSITGRVIATERAGTSGMGNPSYDVTIETTGGETITLLTATNAGIAYGITNPEYRDTAHTFATDRRGRITHTIKS